MCNCTEDCDYCDLAYCVNERRDEDGMDDFRNLEIENGKEVDYETYRR